MTIIDWKTKTALVTGASSGIGAETARFLATQGIHVILVARRIDRLEALSESISKDSGKSTCFQIDLAKNDARLSLIKSIQCHGLNPDILINNAGLAWYGYFSQMPTNLMRGIIDINITAPTHLMREFIPGMINRGFGRVINIGSIAGKLPEQGVAVYSATKAYLDAITKSTFRELKGNNVTVSVLRAGPIRTEFFDTARNLEKGRDVPAEKMAVSSQRVVKKIWWLMNNPRRYAYVPAYMFFSPLLEHLFSGIIDQLGPLLLKRRKS